MNLDYEAADIRAEENADRERLFAEREDVLNDYLQPRDPWDSAKTQAALPCGCEGRMVREDCESFWRWMRECDRHAEAK